MTERYSNHRIKVKKKVSDMREEVISKLKETDNETTVCRAWEVVFGVSVLGAERLENGHKSGVVEVMI